MKYKITPTTPTYLNDDGVQFWKTYCSVLLERDDLKSEYLSSIELLAFNEQQRITIQRSIEKKGLYNEYKGGDVIQSNGLSKMLMNITRDIRQLKKDLHLNPQEIEQVKKNQESSLLNKKRDY